jgi:uncharacterized membrane protein YbhN (UPF0104 family)
VLLTAQGVDVSVRQTLAINLSAFFYNLFLPIGGVGVAAVRLQRLSARAGGRYTAALTAMVCDRLLALVATGIVGFVCCLADPGRKPPGTLLLMLAATGTLALLMAPRAVPTEMRRFARDLQAGGGGTWWAAALLRVNLALGAVARLRPATLALIVAISVVAQLPGIMVFDALGRGLGIPVASVTMAWVRSVVVLITVLPVSVGGLGVREGALVLTLGTLGVQAHDALALAILIFVTTILAPGLAGGLVESVYWLRGARRR